MTVATPALRSRGGADPLRGALFTVLTALGVTLASP